MSSSYKIAFVLVILLFGGIVSYHWLPADHRRGPGPILTSNAPSHIADQAKKPRPNNGQPAQPGIGDLMVRIRSHMDRANRIASQSPTDPIAQTPPSVAATSDRVTVSVGLEPAAHASHEIAGTVPTITFDRSMTVPHPTVTAQQASASAKPREADPQETPLTAPSQARPSATAKVSNKTITYIIEPGDTFSTVAVKIYGSEKQWADIAAANPFIDPKRLQVGQAIRLPTSDDIVDTDTHFAATPRGQMTMYIVRSGDSLSSIAHRYYDAPDQWRLIYDTNREAIGHDPDRLRAGEVLRIPPEYDRAQ